MDELGKALAEVEKLQISKHNYVVWMETDQEKTENLGQLNSSSGFFSKKMKASLETRSSYKPAQIISSMFFRESNSRK